MGLLPLPPAEQVLLPWVLKSFLVIQLVIRVTAEARCFGKGWGPSLGGSISGHVLSDGL